MSPSTKAHWHEDAGSPGFPTQGGGLRALASSAGAQSAPTGPIRLTLAAQGNEARFIVREQLAGAELPNDAIGVTRAITGGITLDARGRVDSSASRISVDLTTLTSDRARRDNFIKRRTWWSPGSGACPRRCRPRAP